ncbi:hypothetical protein D3C71_1034480 [compost metagenome]
MQHMGGHAGVVLMDEAPVGADEDARAQRGLGGRHRRAQQVPQDDLFEQRARRRVRGRILSAVHRRDVAQLRLPEGQQPARLDDGGGQRVAPGDDLVDRDAFAPLQARYQPHVGAGVEPDVVGVLAIDALEAFRDHQPHAGRLLGHRTVFARRALAVAFARHDHVDARLPDRVAADRQRVRRAKAGVRVAAQLLVEVGQDRHGRDLVGGDIVAQRRGLAQVRRGAGQLRGHTGRIPRQEQQAGRAVDDECGGHGDSAIQC